MTLAPRLSVILITFNEEQNVERCLRSVAWADEIVVVDSFSTDRTVEIAGRYTSTIIQHRYDGDILQRQRGIAAASGGWILYIDADEEVSPGLKEEIVRTIALPDARDGYAVPRKVSVLGKWIFHGGWFPDYSMRLFRKDRMIPEHAEVHGGFTVAGEKGRLSEYLYHYTYATIGQYLSKMNDYTSLQVSNKLRGNPGIAVSPGKMVLSPLSHFLRKYFSNRGYKDGMHGFVLAVLGAIYTLSLYAKIWEYQHRRRENAGMMPPITNVELLAMKHRP